MLIKTQNFVQKLNSNLYQYTFNRKQPLILKGSFKTAKYISDIDYTSYVYFNNKFIEILIRKLQRLKNFRFMYLNAGHNKKLAVPWVIDPEDGCNFNLDKTYEWLPTIKPYITKKIYKSIKKILSKKTLRIGDLIDIQEILSRVNTIRWTLPDIINRKKIIDGETYYLLKELENDQYGPVLNSIYIDGQNIISVDIGLVDRRRRFPIWDRMYKYYTSNWYRMLKGYKKLISKDYEDEYNKVMKTMEYYNALLAQTELLQMLLIYKPVSDNQINNFKTQLKNTLKSINININNFVWNGDLDKQIESLDTIVTHLSTRLNIMSYNHIDYFLDKLSNDGKIKAMHRLRLVELTKDPVPKKTLILRSESGNNCPFFTDDTIKNMAVKLLYSGEKLQKCITKISKQENISEKEIFESFKNNPINRMFLQKYKGKIKVRGVFLNKDHDFLKEHEKGREYYVVNKKYLNNMRIYMLIG